MRHCLRKAGFLIVLSCANAGLSGCFDLMGDKVTDPVAGSIAHGPEATNNPPTNTGNPPPAITVGDNYSFTPSASDPDGDLLTFTIHNKPMWAEFDPDTGTLSGVATLGTEGTYSNIQITVHDGNLSADLSLFSIDVTQVTVGAATLSWTPQLQNTDGSTLVDLAAYKIYYGTSPGSYSNQILINNPGLTTLVVDNLVPDTYCFVATSVNSADVESDFSNMATEVVN